MQFLGSWATGDKDRLLHFSAGTLQTFSQHIQENEADCEAGGLLLGSVHGSHLLIGQATVPTAWDKRFRYLFERMPYGHEAIALSRWTATQGIIRYLGEWHTHPTGTLSPSEVDLQSYMRHLHDPELGFDRFVAIIAGFDSSARVLAATWLIERDRIWTVVPERLPTAPAVDSPYASDAAKHAASIADEHKETP